VYKARAAYAMSLLSAGPGRCEKGPGSGPRGRPPPAPVADIGASVDISSKNMNPPRYPPAAQRAGIEGTVILIIDVDANGNVTKVSVEKSSRNRDLDRAAMEAARKWRFNPSIVNGQKAAGRVRVPVDFKLGG
ncbi:hypothetical protein CSC71_04235, partial [Pseudoxanthomonas sangjuensis]